MTYESWNGFKMVKDQLNGREVIVVIPNCQPNGKWMIKTEYFGAFPNAEIALLEKGYHLAYIQNKTRWHLPEDTEAKAALHEYMLANYPVGEKCVPVGMSCGGMQAIYFATKYPQYVSCLYLDAPVVNLLSCPAGLGKGGNDMMQEMTEHTGRTITDLISFRDHPLDRIPALIESKIPVILVCGDSDDVVPYEENGKFIKEAYENAGLTIKTVLKPGCGHHPHGLDDPAEIVDFIMQYDK